MSADCWGCAVNISATGKTGSALGVCVNCGVLGCAGHAERDKVSHKWKCLASVVQAVSNGAGIDDEDAVPAQDVVQSVEDFERRFPVFAEASAHTRQRFRAGDKEGDVARLRDTHDLEGTNFSMVALAVALGHFLVEHRQLEGVLPVEETPTDVLPSRLAELVKATG